MHAYQHKTARICKSYLLGRKQRRAAHIRDCPPFLWLHQVQDCHNKAEYGMRQGDGTNAHVNTRTHRESLGGMGQQSEKLSELTIRPFSIA